MSLELPVVLPIRWDSKHRNPSAWIGIRECTGTMLLAAVEHEHNSDRRQVFGRLYKAFLAAGGQSHEPLCAVLPFPPREPPSWAKQPTTVSLPTRTEAEFPPPELPPPDPVAEAVPKPKPPPKRYRDMVRQGEAAD